MAELQGLTVNNQTSQAFQFQITDNLENIYIQVVGGGSSWNVPGQFPCDQWVFVEVVNPPGQPVFAMVYQALNAKEVIFVDLDGAYALNCLAGVCAGGCDTQLYTGEDAARRGRRS